MNPRLRDKPSSIRVSASRLRSSGMLLLLIASEMRSYAQAEPEGGHSCFVFSTYQTFISKIAIR